MVEAGVMALVVRHIITAQQTVEQVVLEVIYKRLVRLDRLLTNQVVTSRMVVLMLLRVVRLDQQELQMDRLVRRYQAIQVKLINGVYYGRQYKGKENTRWTVYC